MHTRINDTHMNIYILWTVTVAGCSLGMTVTVFMRQSTAEIITVTVAVTFVEILGQYMKGYCDGSLINGVSCIDCRTSCQPGEQSMTK